MKEIIYYDEMCPPSQVRIASQKLCLDHTFTVGAAEKCIGYDDIVELMQSKLIDTLFICFDDGSAFLPNIDGSLLSLKGWYSVKAAGIELKRVSDHYIPNKN